MITLQKKWFHATTKQCWKEIQRSGILWGGKDIFLARNLDELIRMVHLPLIGDLQKCELIVTVRYIPNGITDNYDAKSWEMIVKKSIRGDDVKFLRYL